MRIGDKVKYIGESVKGHLTKNKLYTILKLDSSQVPGQTVAIIMSNSKTSSIGIDVKLFELKETAFKPGEKVYALRSIANDGIITFHEGKQYNVVEPIDDKGRYKFEGEGGRKIRWGSSFFSRQYTPMIQQSNNTGKCTCEWINVLKGGCKCGAIKPYEPIFK